MGNRRYAVMLLGIVASGLALRIASAQGGLWLDEAWSAELVRQVGTPLGIFLNINHDNNHHLNSLWLYCVGFDAPPVLQRALSIVTGTITIAVAAKLFRRRDRYAALIAALLFALSPMLVDLGSAARGYAPMTLALLAAIVLVDRWLTDGEGERIRLRLALCFGLGALSQLTMLFGCIALMGWVFFSLARHAGWVEAGRRTVALFWVPVLAFAVVVAAIAGAAMASETGFQIGDYRPFAFLPFLRAIIDMLGFTIGWPIVSLWLIVLSLLLLTLAPRAGVRSIAFYRLSIVAFPVALALLHVGNTGMPRYYLLVWVALLLLLAETFGAMIARGRGRRLIAIALIVGIVAGSLWQDADQIRNQRGNPDAAIAAMRGRQPAGAVVLLDRRTGIAILTAAAAHWHYPITIVEHGCRPARFLFVDRFTGEDFPVAPLRCGATYRPIASARAHGLSGTHWTLYERRP